MSSYSRNFNSVLVKYLTNHGLNLNNVIVDLIGHHHQLLLSVDLIDSSNSCCNQWMELIEVLQAIIPVVEDQQLLEDIVKDICLVLLRKLQRKQNTQDRNNIGIRLHHNTAALLIGCCWHPKSNKSLSNKLLQHLVESLRNYISEILGKNIDEKWKGVEVMTAIELINFILNWKGDEESAIRQTVEDWNDKIVACIIESLQCADNDISEKSVFEILPKLCKLEPENSTTLDKIWIKIKQLHQSEMNSQNEMKESTALLLICSLADYYLTSKLETTKLSGDEFWQILQIGLVHLNSLTRKRAIYLLRYALDTIQQENISINLNKSGCLFKWDSNQKEQTASIWESYHLIMQTLEETQIHIIKPVLFRIEDIIAATTKDGEGRGLVDISWLTIIYKRIFFHENKFLIKWAILSYLTSTTHDNDGKEVIHMAKYFTPKFFFTDVFRALNNSACYSRDTEFSRDQPSSIATALTTFLTSHFNLVREASTKVQFLNQLLEALVKERFGPYPLLYFSYALSKLQPYPAWENKALLKINMVLFDCIGTHPTLIKATVQCFMLEAMMKMINLQNTSLLDIANCLVVFRKEECFVRGRSLWLKVCNWLNAASPDTSCLPNCVLKVLINKSVMVEFLRTSVADVMDNQNPDISPPSNNLRIISIPALARLLVLIGDCYTSESESQLKEERKDKLPTLPWQIILEPAISIINSLKNSTYISQEKTQNAMMLIFAILLELNLDDAIIQQPPYCIVNKQLQLVFAPLISILLQYARLQLPNSDAQIAARFKSSRLCLNVLEELMKLLWKEDIANDVLADSANAIFALTASCFKSLSNTEAIEQGPLDNINSVMTAAWTSKILTAGSTLDFAKTPHYLQIITYIKEYIPKVIVISDYRKNYVDVHSQAEKSFKGLVTAEYIRCQWQCIAFLISLANNKSNSDSTSASTMSLMEICCKSPVGLLNDAIDSLDVAPINTADSILQCIQLLLPMAFNEDESVCLHAIDCLWQHVNYCKQSHDNFWPVLASFIATILQSYFIQCINLDSIHVMITKYITKLLEMSKSQQGVSNYLVSQFNLVWTELLLQPNQLSSLHKNAENFVKTVLLWACTHGNSYRKDIMHLQDSISFIRSLGQTFPVNQLFAVTKDRCDYLVRVQAINMLCQLSVNNEGHRKFIQQYMLHLLEMDQKMHNSKKRSFINSHVHFTRYRIWQTVMVLVPFIDESYAEVFLCKSLKLLHGQIQPSVRRMIEWSAILLLRNRSLHHLLQDYYSTANTVSSLCSYLGMIFHVSVAASEEHQASIIEKALPLILPLALANNFGIRCFAQAVLQRIWQICLQNNLTLILERFSMIKLLFADKENNLGDSTKQRQKILENFYFSTFNPIEHYSIQTIFQTLPRLTLVCDDEWISPESFMQVDPSLWSGERQIAIFNRDSSLEVCQPGNFKTKNAVSNDSKMTNVSDLSANVQQKITPWKIFPTDDESLLSKQLTLSNGKSREDGLIVVASLIDKAANLGGLCRTCEILGVSRLVISNKNFIENREFQSLSVTAHKWIPIDEVRVEELEEYLISMKQLGYSVVGVEQTANSADLTKYDFAKRSILLLGNEREGIPVPLLKMVDECVAIPQLGTIRSFNVHVTGAVLIWEYSKQHHFSNSFEIK